MGAQAERSCTCVRGPPVALHVSRHISQQISSESWAFSGVAAVSCYTLKGPVALVAIELPGVSHVKLPLKRCRAARIQKYCKTAEKKKLRPWSELTAKMVMGGWFQGWWFTSSWGKFEEITGKIWEIFPKSQKCFTVKASCLPNVDVGPNMISTFCEIFLSKRQWHLEFFWIALMWVSERSDWPYDMCKKRKDFGNLPRHQKLICNWFPEI